MSDWGRDTVFIYYRPTLAQRQIFNYFLVSKMYIINLRLKLIWINAKRLTSCQTDHAASVRDEVSSKAVSLVHIYLSRRKISKLAMWLDDLEEMLPY